MAYSADELTEQLIQLKCRSNFKIKNIAEYMLANSKEAIYTHSEAGKGKIIIRPAFEVFSDDFATIDEVTRVQGYFHSSEMTRFPTRIYKVRSRFIMVWPLKLTQSKQQKTLLPS
ncbi:hypothetical protein P4S68_16395 [Pseudoalteromonas sp. Hal099]